MNTVQIKDYEGVPQFAIFLRFSLEPDPTYVYRSLQTKMLVYMYIRTSIHKNIYAHAYINLFKINAFHECRAILCFPKHNIK